MKKAKATEDKVSTLLFEGSKSVQVPQQTVLDWARESFELAKKDIYGKLKIPNHTADQGKCAVGIAKGSVNQEYLDGNVADVEMQLMRAGGRLARLINEVCNGNGCEANPGAGARGGTRVGRGIE